MMRPGGGVSPQSVGWLAFLMRVSFMVVVTPFMKDHPPHQSMWLVGVFAAILGTAMVWLICAASARQDANIVAQARTQLGSAAGHIVGLALAFYWIVAAAASLRSMGEAYTASTLTGTPVIVLIAALALVSAAIARRGIGLVCAMASVLGFMVLTVIVTAVLLSSGEFNTLNLRPALPEGLKPLVGPAMSSAALWAPVSVAWMIRPRAVNAGQPGIRSLTSQLLLAACASGILLVMVFVAVSAVFGPLTGELSFTVYRLVRIISIGKFIERLEVLALGMWLVTTGMTVATLIWASSQALGEALGLKLSGVLVYPIAGICVALSDAMFETSIEVHEFTSIEGMGATAVAALVAFSLVMLAAAGLRRWRGGGARGKAGRAALGCIGILLLCALTSGCWDRREIEDIGFVTACAIDTANAGGKPEDAGLVQVSVQIAKPWAMTTGGGTPGLEKVYAPVTATGRTVFEAVRNMNERSSRKPYWSHNRLLAFGEDMAVAGVDSVLDFFMRDGETRMETQIAVVEGGRGWDLASVEFAMERQPAAAAEGATIDTLMAVGTTIRTTIKAFLIALADHGVDPITARVAMLSPTGEPAVTGSVVREDIDITVEVHGSAAFRGARLAGWLTGAQTRGVNWIRGDVKSAIVPIVVGEGSSAEDFRNYVSIEIQGSSSHVEVAADKESGEVSAKVKIKVNGAVGESRTEEKVNHDDVIEMMQKELAEAVRNEAVDALRRLQELKSDVIGFGRRLMASDLAAWRRVESQWYDIYPVMEVDVEVKAYIDGTGLATGRYQLHKHQ